MLLVLTSGFCWGVFLDGSLMFSIAWLVLLTEMLSVMLLKMLDCLLAKTLNGVLPRLLGEMLRSVLVPGMYPEMFPEICLEMNFPVLSLGMLLEMVVKMLGCLLLVDEVLAGLSDLPVCMFMNLELYSPWVLGEKSSDGAPTLR